MAQVETREVAGAEADIRLDRWFKRYYPALSHGRLEKLLRTGQVRVDGGRVKAGERLKPGQAIRIPPLGESSTTPKPKQRPKVSEYDAKELRARVLYEDKEIIVINKPAGLAVQGGSKTTRHIDGMLDVLADEKGERPRLVHRLDKDTSGVLVLARTVSAADRLGKAFRSRQVTKLYWALVVGEPERDQGRIDLAMTKKAGARGERMEEDGDGQKAITEFAIIDRIGRQAAWLALRPLTGRTHQLRVHCAAIGTPILGDGKYGGAGAFLSGVPAKDVHLHARAIEIPKRGGGTISVIAPLPDHMRATWRLFGFNANDTSDPFDEEFL